MEIYRYLEATNSGLRELLMDDPRFSRCLEQNSKLQITSCTLSSVHRPLRVGIFFDEQTHVGERTVRERTQPRQKCVNVLQSKSLTLTCTVDLVLEIYPHHRSHQLFVVQYKWTINRVDMRRDEIFHI
jgi:hypothetical protein